MNIVSGFSYGRSRAWAAEGKTGSTGVSILVRCTDSRDFLSQIDEFTVSEDEKCSLPPAYGTALYDGGAGLSDECAAGETASRYIGGGEGKRTLCRRAFRVVFRGFEGPAAGSSMLSVSKTWNKASSSMVRLCLSTRCFLNSDWRLILNAIFSSAQEEIRPVLTAWDSLHGRDNPGTDTDTLRPCAAPGNGARGKKGRRSVSCSRGPS